MPNPVLQGRPAAEPPPSALDIPRPIPDPKSQTLTGSGMWSCIRTSPPSAFHSYSSVSRSTMTQLITFRKIIKTYPKCILLWKEQQATSKTDKSRSCSSNLLCSIRNKREKKWLCLENRAVWIGNELCVFWLYECIALINYLNCRKKKTHTQSIKQTQNHQNDNKKHVKRHRTFKSSLLLESQVYYLRW